MTTATEPDYEHELKQLGPACQSKLAQVRAKFNQINEGLKGQIALKRLIKRN